METSLEANAVLLFSFEPCLRWSWMFQMEASSRGGLDVLFYFIYGLLLLLLRLTSFPFFATAGKMVTEI